MYSRDAISQLKEWAESDHRKPLIVRGARQVGKTSVVKEFGRSFENFIYVNLEDKIYRDIFDNFVNLDYLLVQLYALNGKPIRKGKTLIFFDEIQNSAEAIKQLRYFYEDKPEIYVIAAGSLLETLINVHLSFPVGRVQYMAMHPCSFREFLVATGSEHIRRYIEEHPEHASAFHDTLMSAFRSYMLVGGMPEAVAMFVETKDVLSLDGIYESLLRSYRDDVEKYARNNSQGAIIRFIIDKGWTQVASKITLGKFAGSEYRAREMGEAFRTLERAYLLELVYPNSNTIPPVLPQHTRAPKLIWLDVGLVNYAANIRKDIFVASDVVDVWRGAIAEQVVAQELLTLSDNVNAQRYFWSRPKSDAEVDFEYMFEGKVVPIEVKSGHNAKLLSLHEFMDSCNHDVAVRVWSKPYQVDRVKTKSGKEFSLLNVPFYMVGFLPRILSEFIPAVEMKF
ncbi:MAG: ATP-binding protein [Bacteroidales bacterium]|nr:ATP-binding protein [Bacteroidales bacterium]